MLDKDEQVACLEYLRLLIESFVARHNLGEEAEDEVLAKMDHHWDHVMNSRCHSQIRKMDICTFFQDLTMFGDEE